MTRQLATSSAETAARYQAARHRKDSKAATAPVYATDGIPIPRRKRRILLDLAPETVKELLRWSRIADVGPTTVAIERVLVASLERAR